MLMRLPMCSRIALWSRTDQVPELALAVVPELVVELAQAVLMEVVQGLNGSSQISGPTPLGMLLPNS
jgi:hypothetical protein